MPRFVVLFHDTPPGYERPSHYDLMLERDGTLLTWALPSVPTVGVIVAAERLADHRIAYLDYEGPVSGDRGSVTRWDNGEYSLRSDEVDRIVVVLQGGLLQGALEFARDADSASRWRVRFEPNDE